MSKIKNIFFTDIQELAIKKTMEHRKMDITAALECDLLTAFDWKNKRGWIYLHRRFDEESITVTRKALKKYILTLKQ